MRSDRDAAKERQVWRDGMKELAEIGGWGWARRHLSEREQRESWTDAPPSVRRIEHEAPLSRPGTREGGF